MIKVRFLQKSALFFTKNLAVQKKAPIFALAISKWLRSSTE